MARILPDPELQKSLASLPDWTLQNGQLERTLKFKDFSEAITFVNKVAHLADMANHHPDIDIRWNMVRLSLFTHSQKALTEMDIDLAGKISLLCS